MSLTKFQRSVLELLRTEPDRERWFTCSDVSAALSVSPHGVGFSFAALLRRGLVKRRTQGRQCVYRSASQRVCPQCYAAMEVAIGTAFWWCKPCGLFVPIRDSRRAVAP